MPRAKKATEANKKGGAGTPIRVSGTSPLSFEVFVGSILAVKEFAPSHYTRPTAGSGFKSSGYLLFHDQTKVGRLSPENVNKLGKRVPTTCTVAEVDKARKILRVVFGKLK